MPPDVTRARFFVRVAYTLANRSGFKFLPWPVDRSGSDPHRTMPPMLPPTSTGAPWPPALTGGTTACSATARRCCGCLSASTGEGGLPTSTPSDPIGSAGRRGNAPATSRAGSGPSCSGVGHLVMLRAEVDQRIAQLRSGNPFLMRLPEQSASVACVSARATAGAESGCMDQKSIGKARWARARAALHWHWTDDLDSIRSGDWRAQRGRGAERLRALGGGTRD
jgi:hypothetical protein